MISKVSGKNVEYKWKITVELLKTSNEIYLNICLAINLDQISNF